MPLTNAYREELGAADTHIMARSLALYNALEQVELLYREDIFDIRQALAWAAARAALKLAREGR